MCEINTTRCLTWLCCVGEWSTNRHLASSSEAAKTNHCKSMQSQKGSACLWIKCASVDSEFAAPKTISLLVVSFQLGNNVPWFTTLKVEFGRIHNTSLCVLQSTKQHYFCTELPCVFMFVLGLSVHKAWTESQRWCSKGLAKLRV